MYINNLDQNSSTHQVINLLIHSCILKILAHPFFNKRSLGNDLYSKLFWAIIFQSNNPRPLHFHSKNYWPVYFYWKNPLAKAWVLLKKNLVININHTDAMYHDRYLCPIELEVLKMKFKRITTCAFSWWKCINSCCNQSNRISGRAPLRCMWWFVIASLISDSFELVAHPF